MKLSKLKLTKLKLTNLKLTKLKLTKLKVTKLKLTKLKLTKLKLIWRHLASSGVFWRHLPSSGVIWRHLASTRVIWPHLASPGVIWPHLAESSRIWRHLASSGLIWPLLASSGVIWFRGVEFPKKMCGNFVINFCIKCLTVWRLLGLRLPRDSFGGSAGRSDARSGRTSGTANGTPLFGASPHATEGFGVICASVVVPLLLPLPQRCATIWWYFCAQSEAIERLQPRRSPHVFMGFVVAFVVDLLWICCCVVVGASPTVCEDLVVFLCTN